MNTSAYIHRNPDDVAFTGRLHEYRWSSLRWYASDASAPTWLSQGLLLDWFAGDRDRFVAYVEQSDAA